MRCRRQVWRHKLGSDPGDDALVYHETDEAFYVGVGMTRSKRFLYIHAGMYPTAFDRRTSVVFGDGCLPAAECNLAFCCPWWQ